MCTQLTMSLSVVVQDMNLFYAQYQSIQPWLQRKDNIKLGEKEIFQTEEERSKLVRPHECQYECQAFVPA